MKKLKCATCGAEHELLDPAFRRPEAFVQLDLQDRERYAGADDDHCRIALPAAQPRYFIRGTLPVDVAGYSDGIWWGVWAEISATDFNRYVEIESEDDQAAEPPFAGTLANVIPSYPDTLGLPLTVHLTDPASRPHFRFTGDDAHPFVAECNAGIDMHRAAEWVELISSL